MRADQFHEINYSAMHKKTTYKKQVVFFIQKIETSTKAF